MENLQKFSGKSSKVYIEIFKIQAYTVYNWILGDME